MVAIRQYKADLRQSEMHPGSGRRGRPLGEEPFGEVEPFVHLAQLGAELIHFGPEVLDGGDPAIDQLAGTELRLLKPGLGELA